MEIIESKRGKPVILYSGFKYNKKKVYQNNEILWACANRSCNGSIKTDSDIKTVLKQKEHSVCAPDVAKNKGLVFVSNAKKRMREETVPVAQIYEEEVTKKAADEGFDFVTKIPRFYSVKKQLYSARHSETKGSTTHPKNIIPKNNEHFVFNDSKPELEDDIFSEDGEELLRRGKILFDDSTCKNCPKLFQQLYKIHMDIRKLLHDEIKRKLNEHPKES